ncbi:MAG: PadR family transcriptional regulator [Sphingomonadaceae bacterium]
MGEEPGALTDHEGTLLGLIVRAGPLTAYQVGKIYDRSPVSNFNTSKGKLYPLIRRLRQRGLLAAIPVEDDARGTEKLAATEAGKAAVRRWCMEIKPAHLLLDDPLRTKVQSFELFSREERVEWCVTARALLSRKLKELEAYKDEVEVPFHDYVHSNAAGAIRQRIEWLDTLLHGLTRPSS